MNTLYKLGNMTRHRGANKLVYEFMNYKFTIAT